VFQSLRLVVHLTRPLFHALLFGGWEGYTALIIASRKGEVHE
jgi:hypothetical protein